MTTPLYKAPQELQRKKELQAERKKQQQKAVNQRILFLLSQRQNTAKTGRTRRQNTITI